MRIAASQKYRARRAILLALARFGLPQNLEVVCCDDRVISEQLEGAILAREWEFLTEEGYLLPVPGYPAYRKLAPHIREMIESGQSLLTDPLLAGPGALV